MKRITLMFAVIAALAALPASAEMAAPGDGVAGASGQPHMGHGAPNQAAFQEFKQHQLQMLDQRQAVGQEVRACVQAAQEPQALRQCHEIAMKGREQMQGARQSMRSEMAGQRAAMGERRMPPGAMAQGAPAVQ